ncbi:5518_t:CDS:2, partial [Entrophospora sp. SA101]
MTIKPHDNNKQLKLQQLLMEWIIFDNQSLNIFKSDSFKTFINSLDPAFSIPDVKFIKQLIHKSYNHTLPLIIKHIEENALSVSLTTDMWTGRNILGFLDVTCSYLDENFKMHEQVLAVDYVRYPHTANHISDTLLAILDEWGVRDLTHIITTDNGSNIKKAIKDMELIAPNIFWQPCSAHTLQLVIGKGLSVIKPLVKRAKRLIDFFLRPKQSECLINIQMQMKRHSDVDLSETSNYFIQCIGDVPTRWNSSYLAWTRLIKIKEFISLLAKIKTRLKNNIQSNSISDFETFNLEELDDVFNGEFIEEIEDAEQNDFNLNQPMHTEEQNIKDDYKLNLQLKYNQISAQQSTITNISSTNVNRDCTLVETETPTLFSIFN